MGTFYLSVMPLYCRIVFSTPWSISTLQKIVCPYVRFCTVVMLCIHRFGSLQVPLMVPKTSSPTNSIRPHHLSMQQTMSAFYKTISDDIKTYHRLNIPVSAACVCVFCARIKRVTHRTFFLCTAFASHMGCTIFVGEDDSNASILYCPFVLFASDFPFHALSLMFILFKSYALITFH